MAAAERLQVGAVGERDLDLHEHVSRPRHRVGHVLDAHVAGRVEAKPPSRREDDLERLAGAVCGEALGEALERQDQRRRQLERRQQLDRVRKYAGVPERDPTSDSSLR